MEGTFVRENNVNYLKITCANQDGMPPYLMKMLACNEITGLLSMHERVIDNITEYHYNVKAYKPIAMLYQTHNVTIDEIVRILQCLDKSIKDLEEFFLERDGIILNPQYVMFDTAEKKAYFVYVPCKKERFEEELRHMLEFMMEHMEHSDRNKTIRFYEAYQDVIRGSSDVRVIIEKLTADDSETGSEKEEGRKEAETEYIIPDVMSENIEQETETETFNPGKAGRILKSVSATAVFAAVLSQIFSKELPVDVPLQVAAIITVVAACVYKSGMHIEKIPASRFAKVVRTTEEVPYSFSEEKNDINISGQDAFEEDNSEENTTMLLSQAIKRKCILELESANGHINDSIYIEKLPCVLGCAGTAADVVVQQPFVSRMHARIDKDIDNNCYIQDLFSTNGTFVNDRRLVPEEKQVLRDGDIVVLASSEYRVVM
ncbi:MAG: DUF6382 domain-containing protein [Bacteroides sp.]